jgi:polysaccharide biosynthesis transport protein
MDLLSQQGGFQALKISPPGPGWKIGPKEFQIYGLGIMLGLLAGCGLSYLGYLMDQSFRSPEEIRRRLGLPLIGHIPSFSGRKEKKTVDRNALPLDRSLLTYFRSKSREAEAYRGVRTALFFSTRGEGHKVIQVTSPDMGDGKTTLAANLAVSIAQSEKKIILIDADLRRPRIHKLFGLSNECGLSGYLTNEAELSDLVQESGIPGLSILPTGPTPPNPAELLSLPRFREFLEQLRHKYDFVIVDTPPLLAVTDPCAVAPHVDGVLLTIRLSKNARPHAQRAKEILATLGAPVIGIVVNGVSSNNGSGYGYNAYSYGYAYGYGYGQGYGYGYTTGNDSYYTSDGKSPDRKGSTQTSSSDTHIAVLDEGDAEMSRRDNRRRPKSRKGFFGWLFQR